ncbi:hypothetical protein [Rhodohalobacter barkolensis]|uniref:Uncharacterized protein n=1 Tax=Rhodohalobacter barkolensis TaxID=2053187 RepID=A0A2N0VM49_9BACT|nr:hypothetical protein [Rhodohalobacter barkolensis]PKD45285.1 hypothetical protein CWD77_07535 [Rhodohalobacter barkolensis]
MKAENEQLAKLYRQTGRWVNDTPVNEENHWCSRCKNRLGKTEKISFTVYGLLWKPFRFEYHPVCLIKALNEWENNLKEKKHLSDAE